MTSLLVRRLIASFLGMAVCVLSAAAQRFDEMTTEQLLDRLDEAIRDKPLYRQKFEEGLTPLRIKAEKGDQKERAEAYALLFHAYVHHQSDTALAYLNRMQLLPQAATDKDYATSITIGRAETYGVMGLYKAAAETLESIDLRSLSPDTRLYYYQVCRTVYGWMTDFGEAPGYHKDFTRLTAAYRDSIIQAQPAGIDRDIVRADKMIVEGQARTVYGLCRQALAKADDKQRTYLYIIMADAAYALGRTDDNIRYLTLAALNDVQRGITEYKALPRLALALSERGASHRAYEYLLCTMEDANYCKARLRTFEASSIFPIIERAHKEKQRERLYIYVAIAVFSVLAVVMLIGFILLTRRQMRKVSQARSELAEALTSIRQVNAALVKANAELSTSDKVKDTYIARYLQRCRGYIDTLDAYRRQLLKLAKAKQYEELTARLQGSEFLNAEERNFYADFDEAFVTLFPGFIENFNALLLPEARTYPKREEILNTELRIFALVRLGVTDSNRIAHFLNYSLPTIYSYRSRLRNKSCLPKSEFDQAVMTC